MAKIYVVIFARPVNFRNHRPRWPVDFLVSFVPWLNCETAVCIQCTQLATCYSGSVAVNLDWATAYVCQFAPHVVHVHLSVLYICIHINSNLLLRASVTKHTLSLLRLGCSYFPFGGPQYKLLSHYTMWLIVREWVALINYLRKKRMHI